VAGATHAAVGGTGGVLVLTTAANTPPPTLGADAPDTTAPLLDFAGFGADRSGGSVLVTVGCGASEAQGCRVLLRLVTRRKLKATRRAKAKRLEVGRRQYTLRAGERLRLRVPLSRLGKRLLRKYKRLSLRADLEIADIAGNKVTTSQTVTVEQPKKKRR